MAVQLKNVPEKDRPNSELYRESAAAWCELDGAARLLEESKTSVLAERINQHVLQQGGNVAHNAAERCVKGSASWQEYITEMCEAKTKANRAKVSMEYYKMRATEWAVLNATSRRERGMS